MNLMEFHLPRPQNPKRYLIDYFRINDFEWNGYAASEIVIPKDGKLCIEITGEGHLRVFRS